MPKMWSLKMPLLIDDPAPVADLRGALLEHARCYFCFTCRSKHKQTVTETDANAETPELNDGRLLYL